ncbi:MAG TPA: hypothetical protein VGQ59_21295 [Cyclobacteriaceae bacterium]|jgi:hypothetical protein|nr:hypothetical protein [Cyclobacteriaceae bacterium]
MLINKKYFYLSLLVILFLFASNLSAQVFKVDLSKKNLAKIEKGKSAFDKLKRYHKAYSQDSLKKIKKISKIYHKKMDSLARTSAKEEKLIATKRKKGIRIPLDTLAFLKQYTSLLPRDSSSHDSVAVKKKIKKDSSSLDSVAIKKASTGDSSSRDSSAMKKTGKRDSSSLDSRALKKEASQQLTSLEKQQVQRLQKEYGLSTDQAKRYLKCDSATRRKIAIDGLKQLREKSLSQLPAGQRKQLESFQKQYGPYSTEVKQYAFFLKDSVDRTDTIKALAAARAEGLANQIAGQKLGGAGLNQFNDYEKRLKELKDLRSQYQKQIEDNKNPEHLKEKAKDEAMEKVAKKVQKNMSLLKNKYSSLLNSNDLSTGIKAKSLKGQPFRKRLVLGGNFNIVNISPFMADLAPVIGYKIDKTFQVGVSGSYRVSFVDTTKIVSGLSAKTTGYSVFVSHDVILNFFAYGEWERSYTTVKQNVNDPKTSKQWVNSLLIGIGRQFTISKKVKGTVMLLWNPLHESGKTPYNSDFVVKTGFRLNK